MYLEGESLQVSVAALRLSGSRKIVHTEVCFGSD
jgi:hypothetical protein